MTARFAADLARIWPEGAGASDARLGLAVSGGADSLALLLLAAAALPQGRVEAGIVDHGLRAESAAEAAGVAAICGVLGVPHRELTIAVGPGNRQAKARAARYTALNAWCGERGLKALATGHHADDQAETLIMRLNRGSGLAGLAGVRARGVVAASALPLLRPLLAWRRSELAAIVARAGLDPVRDPANGDPRYDRARVRAAMADADWLHPEGWSRSAALLGEAESYVVAAVTAAWDRCVTRRDGGYCYVAGGSDFEATEIAIRIITALGGDVTRAEAAALVARLRRGDTASLGGVLARAADGVWAFAPEPSRRG